MKTTASKIAWTLLVLSALLYAYQNWGGGGVPSNRIIPGEGVMALIVEESDQRGGLDSEQVDVLLGKSWTSKVDSYLIADKDTEFTGNSPYKDAFERDRTSLPWCVASGPSGNYEGELPTTPTAMVELVEGLQ